MSDSVEIYTDGACKGNPGPGGWGVLIVYKGVEKELWGGERETTNNRMELMAAIEGLKALKRECEVLLTTDSQYVMKGINEWMVNWKKRGWKTAAKEPVKNADLWVQLDEQVNRHKVTWKWVRGHIGHPGNERPDLPRDDRKTAPISLYSHPRIQAPPVGVPAWSSSKTNGSSSSTPRQPACRWPKATASSRSVASRSWAGA